MPLKSEIVEDKIIISFSIDTLICATEKHPEFQLYDEEKHEYRSTVKVIDKREFAKEIIVALGDEREDGSSYLSDILDSAIKTAIEDGCLGVDHEALCNNFT